MEPQAPVLNQAQHGPALPGEGTRSKVSPGCNLIVKPTLELQNTSARCFSSNTLGVHRETLTSCCRWRKDSPPGITGWAAALPGLRPWDEGLGVSPLKRCSEGTGSTMCRSIPSQPGNADRALREVVFIIKLFLLPVSHY